jgi:hypothetical protein
MRSLGYFTEDQLKGTKEVLINRIRTTLPYVTFEIDSREPLQVTRDENAMTFHL